MGLGEVLCREGCGKKHEFLIRSLLISGPATNNLFLEAVMAQ